MRDISQTVKSIRANGFAMVTSREVPHGAKVKGDIAVLKGNVSVAYALAPDDVVVGFVEQRKQVAPIMFHDVYFETPDNAAMEAWYAKIFGLRKQSSVSEPVATLPGGVFYFAHADGPVSPIRGRSITLVLKSRTWASFARSWKRRESSLTFHIAQSRPSTRIPRICEIPWSAVGGRS